MSIATIANIIGNIGVFIILLTYFLLQSNRLSSETIFYSFANAVGSAMILFSLFFAWNTPAALVEAVWVIISCYGLFKRLFQFKKTSKVPSNLG